MYILDTDIVIWLMRNEKKVVRWVKKIISKDQTAISTITVAEIYKNIYPEEIEAFDDFLQKQEIIPVSVEIAKEAGLYWREFHKKLSQLSITDCIVAASALINRAPLATINVKHFPMENINVVSPSSK